MGGADNVERCIIDNQLKVPLCMHCEAPGDCGLLCGPRALCVKVAQEAQWAPDRVVLCRPPQAHRRSGSDAAVFTKRHFPHMLAQL